MDCSVALPSLGCHVGAYISLAMEMQLPPERVVLCIQPLLEIFFICLLVLH